MAAERERAEAVGAGWHGAPSKGAPLHRFSLFVAVAVEQRMDAGKVVSVKTAARLAQYAKTFTASLAAARDVSAAAVAALR